MVFPGLRDTGYRITSPETPQYNCIAWAADDTRRWWWPDALEIAYWPPARQLVDGSWTSKLGCGVDIEHMLQALECELYGIVVSVMRRPSRGEGRSRAR